MTVTEVEKTAEELAADDTAEEEAFLTGFGEPSEEPAEPEVIEETVEVPVEVPVEAEPELPKTLTIDDLTAAIAASKAEQQKQFDRLFGTVGDLKSRAEKLENAQAKFNAMSKKQQDALSVEFPELAAIMNIEVDDFIPTHVPKEQPVADPRVDDLSRTFERKLLTRDHRDWEQVVVSPEFSQWKSQLPQAEAEELDNSWDADLISGKITRFKEWQKEQLNATAEAERQTAEEAARKKRLDNAVVPRGAPRDTTSSHLPDDEESAMMSSFKKR